MKLKNLFNRNTERSAKFKEMQENLHLAKVLEERQKSANERELESFLEAARKKQIEEQLKQFRKKQQEEMMRTTILKEEFNIAKDKNEVMGSGSNLLKDKKLFTLNKPKQHNMGFFK